MAEPSKPRDPLFLIIAGAITALFLPFAIAFPPTLIEKLAAVAVLVLVAAGASALILKVGKTTSAGPDRSDRR